MRNVLLLFGFLGILISPSAYGTDSHVSTASLLDRISVIRRDGGSLSQDRESVSGDLAGDVFRTMQPQSSNVSLALADVLTYDNFYDGIDWSFTNSPSCPSTPGSSTRCGYSSNNRWARLSWNWSSCPLYPTLASASSSYLYLQVPGNLQKKGAQIESIRSDYWYGSYRARIKAGAHSGTTSQGSVNGFFFYNTATQQEIDVEILTNEHESKKVHFVTHPGNYEKICSLSQDPTTTFIEYGFDWYKNTVKYFVNGVKCNEDARAVPSTKGTIILNHWTGNAGWGGTPPPSASTMSVDYVWHVPFLLVTSPDAAGIAWTRGTSKTISWNKYGDVAASSVTIELWKGGAFYQTIRSRASNTGTYTWAVPSSLPIASNYRIKIKSTLSGDYYDFSNNDFRIQ